MKEQLEHRDNGFHRKWAWSRGRGCGSYDQVDRRDYGLGPRPADHLYVAEVVVRCFLAHHLLTGPWMRADTANHG